jgi:MFS family permease
MFALRKALAEMSFTNMNLVLNNSVPSGRRGVFNGFSMAVSGFGKMAGPAIGGPLFAWSITNGLGWPFDHSLSFYGCAMITAILAWITFRMPESIAFPCEEDHEGKGTDESVSLARPQTAQA